MACTSTLRELNRSMVLFFLFLAVAACGGAPDTYHDPQMDFASLRTIAIMPFKNLTQDDLAAERLRDTFSNKLLSTGSLYVIPSGEVARGISRIGIVDSAAPSCEEISRLAAVIKADAVITGTVREYGEVRSGTTLANVISVSLAMLEVQTGKVVWGASSTQGGISTTDRLFGGGGRPMNDVTEAAVNDLIVKLFNIEVKEVKSEEAAMEEGDPQADKQTKGETEPHIKKGEEPEEPEQMEKK